MNMFSLRTLIDDILLLVRNNNISESEDLSRLQIASWILAYKKYLAKKLSDQDKALGDDSETSLDDFKHTYGPLELEVIESLDDTPLFRKRTVDTIPQLLNDDECNLISVQDQEWCPIQIMNEQRRHFHFFRKYTGGELTAWYQNGYIYIEGLDDCNNLQYIWITGLFEDEVSEDSDEDDITIPGWMIPDIKKLIMQNELTFMLNRISDDDNNSTLDGIKPQPQTTIGNEK